MTEKPKVPHINARAETVHKLPLFLEALAKRHALIPATGFFEWQLVADGGNQPGRFKANTVVRGMHDRMRLRPPREDCDRANTKNRAPTRNPG